MRRVSMLLIGGLMLANVAMADGPSRDAVRAAAAEYVRAVGVDLQAAQAERAVAGKAVSRTDKAEATFIGTIYFVEDTDSLDDGTPFRIVALENRRPFDQINFVVCVGGSAVSTCGRLVEGRRVQFTADVLTVEDGESAGLALFIAKKIKT